MPASGASGLALGAWVLHRNGMPGDRIARRSVAFFLIKSSVNFVAVAVIGTLLAVGVLGPDLSLWLTAWAGGAVMLLITVVLLLPKLGKGPDPSPKLGAGRPGAHGGAAGDRGRDLEAIVLIRLARPLILVGAIANWAFDNAVLWATF